jgi:hypothetical protein
MNERKIGPLPDDVRDAPREPEKHWSILDNIKSELQKSGRSGIIIKVEVDAAGEKKLADFLKAHHCQGTTKKDYLVIEHATQAKELLQHARAAGLIAELFEPKK